MGGSSAAAAGLPPLAVLSATAAGMALPYAEIVAHRVFDEFRSDARARADAMLASADHELGDVGLDGLADMTGKSEQTRLFTSMAVDAAARTAWPPKVIALGRVLAAGLIAKDAAAVDLEQLALAAMADMERPHVSLLELLIRWQPASTDAEAPYAARRPGEHRYWGEAEAMAARPRLEPALGLIFSTLTRHGLAVRNMTDFPTPHLLATPYGERLLSFYDIAADRPAVASAPA